MLAPSLDSAQPASRLLETLPVMRQLVWRECSRRGLHSESDDLFSELAVKLLDQDCAVLRQFEARGDFRGFLTRIIQRLIIDHHRRLRGKWRPAASSRRAGPAAILLDRLITRDGFSRAVAVQLTADAFGITASRVEELYRAMSVAPRRRELCPVPPTVTPFTSDVEVEENRRELRRLRDALTAALVELSAEDRALVRQRYQGDLSITAIAAARGIERKPLYRRLERIHTMLRRRLVALGIDRGHVLGLLDEDRLSD